MCIFKNKKELSEKIQSIIIYNCQNFNINILKQTINLEEQTKKVDILLDGIFQNNNG